MTDDQLDALWQAYGGLEGAAKPPVTGSFDESRKRQRMLLLVSRVVDRLTPLSRDEVNEHYRQRHLECRVCKVLEDL